MILGNVFRNLIMKFGICIFCTPRFFSIYGDNKFLMERLPFLCLRIAIDSNLLLRSYGIGLWYRFFGYTSLRELRCCSLSLPQNSSHTSNRHPFHPQASFLHYLRMQQLQDSAHRLLC